MANLFDKNKDVSPGSFERDFNNVFDDPQVEASRKRIGEMNQELAAIEQMKQGDYYSPSYGSEIDINQGRLAEAGSQFTRGFADTLASVPKGLGALDEYLVSQFGGGTQLGGGEYKSALTSLGESVSETAAQADINPEYQGEFLATQLPQGIGSTAGFLAGGLLGRTSAAARLAIPATMGVTASGVSQIEDFERTTGRSATPEEKAQILGYNVPVGALEALPVTRALDRFSGGPLSREAIKQIKEGGTKEFLKQSAKLGTKGALEEGTQEALQQAGQNIIASDIMEYDQDRKVMEGLADSASVGGVTGFLMNAALGSLGIKTRLGQLNAEEQARADILRRTQESQPQQPQPGQDLVPTVIPMGQDQQVAPEGGPLVPQGGLPATATPVQEGQVIPNPPGERFTTPEQQAVEEDIMNNFDQYAQEANALTTEYFETGQLQPRLQQTMQALEQQRENPTAPMTDEERQAAFGMMMPLYEPIMNTKYGQDRQALLDTALEKMRKNIVKGAAPRRGMSLKERNTLREVFNYSKLTDEVITNNTDEEGVVDTEAAAIELSQKTASVAEAAPGAATPKEAQQEISPQEAERLIDETMSSPGYEVQPPQEKLLQEATQSPEDAMAERVVEADPEQADIMSQYQDFAREEERRQAPDQDLKDNFKQTKAEINQAEEQQGVVLTQEEKKAAKKEAVIRDINEGNIDFNPEEALTEKERRSYAKLKEMEGEGSLTTKMEDRLFELEEKIQGHKDEIAEKVVTTEDYFDEITRDVPVDEDIDINFMYDPAGEGQIPENLTVSLSEAKRNLDNFLELSQEKNVLFHGTFDRFDVVDLDIGEMGFHVGTKKAAFERINGLKTSRSNREGWSDPYSFLQAKGRIVPYNIQAKNPLRMDDLGAFDPDIVAEELINNHHVNSTIARIPKFVTDEDLSLLNGVLEGYRQVDRELAASYDATSKPDLKAEWIRIAKENNLDLKKQPADHDNILKAAREKYQKQVREFIQSKGYDSIVYKNTGEDIGSDSYILFDRGQMKYAHDNRGTYDPAVGHPKLRIEDGIGTRMSKTDVLKAKQMVDRITAKNPELRITLADNWEDPSLPAWARRLYLDNAGNLQKLYSIRGMNRGNENVILASNVKDLANFQRTLFHEVVGHYSMEKMFGKDFNNLLDKLSSNTKFHSQLRQMADRYGFDLTTVEGKRSSAKELIASTAEEGTNPGLVKRMVAWVRHQLRKLGIVTKISENDLTNYIAKAARNVDLGRIPPNKMTSKQVLLQLTNDLDNPKASVEVRNAASKIGELRLDPSVVRRSWGEFSQKSKEVFDQMANRPFWQQWTALKGLTDADTYRSLRNIRMGDKNKFDNYAEKLHNAFKDLSGSDQKAVVAYMEDPNASIESVPESVREDAEEAKNVIVELGQMLVDRGMLSEETYEANKGGYIGRQYLMYLMDSKRAGSQIGSGSKVSFLNYLKQRKDLTPEQKQLLGEVRDPAMLIPHTVATIGRDVALLDMMTDISQFTKEARQGNPWVLDDITVDVPGYGETSLGDALSFLQSTEENVKKYLSPEDYSKWQEAYDQNRDAIVAQIEDSIRAEALNGIDINDYVKVADSRRHGAFRNRWIRKEIYDDLLGTSLAVESVNPGAIEKLLSQRGFLSKMQRMWKSMKTIWNPPTHVRNYISNFLLLDMSSSTASHRLLADAVSNSKKAVRAFHKKERLGDIDEYWKIAEDYGITEGTYTAQETLASEKEWRTLESLEGKKQWFDHVPTQKARQWFQDHFPHMGENVVKLADKMGEAYQLNESVFKVTKIKDVLDTYTENTGQDWRTLPQAEQDALKAHAVNEANRAILNYAEAPRSVKFLRNAPIGAPFISFSYLVMPRIAEGVMRHPVKVAKYAALPYMISSLAAAGGAVDGEDDWDKIKAQLPSGIRDKSGLMMLPVSDGSGNPIVVDMGYFLPWNAHSEVLRDYYNMAANKKDVEFVSPILENLGILGGPVPDAVTVLKNGIDPFTGRPVYNEYDSTSSKVWDSAVYSFRMAMPTFMTDIGTLGKAVSHITGEDIDQMSNEPKYSAGGIAASAFGVNVYQPDLQTSRVKNIRWMRSQIQKQKASNRKEIKEAVTKGASVEELASLRKKHSGLLRDRNERLRNYLQEINKGEGDNG